MTAVGYIHGVNWWGVGVGVATCACVVSCALLVDLDALHTSDKDAGVDGAPSGHVVKCKGGPSCNVPDECCVTCHNDDAGGCSYTFACIDQQTSCGGNTIGCSDQASCPPDQVCCAVVGPNNQYFITSSCMTNAECLANGEVEILCDPNAKPACPDGGTCAVGSSGSFAGLYECQ